MPYLSLMSSAMRYFFGIVHCNSPNTRTVRTRPSRQRWRSAMKINASPWYACAARALRCGSFGPCQRKRVYAESTRAVSRLVTPQRVAGSHPMAPLQYSITDTARLLGFARRAVERLIANMDRRIVPRSKPARRQSHTQL